MFPSRPTAWEGRRTKRDCPPGVARNQKRPDDAYRRGAFARLCCRSVCYELSLKHHYGFVVIHQFEELIKLGSNDRVFILIAV